MALRRDFWFGAAWVLLVLVIASGFWLQQRIIDRLDEQGRHLVFISVQANRNRQEEIAAICQITLEIHPHQREEVIAAFARAGVPCQPRP